jgi:RecB family exonuclease
VDRGSRPAAENAILAALHGASRDRFRALLTSAVAESAAEDAAAADGAPAAAVPADRLAAARVAVLDEIDPDLRTPQGLAVAATIGPYLGFIGRRAGGSDRRGGGLWVTQAENLAACPWQLFLERLLALEPTPDPLQSLPGTDPLLLGSVVHSVFEAIAEEAGVPSGEELAAAAAADRPARPVPLPPAADLERRLLSVAREVLLDEGIPLPGLARALAAQAAGFLERARQLDWVAGAGDPEVLGVETVGRVKVEDGEGKSRHLEFKADRVDRTEAAGASGLRFTDYKTGRPPSTAKTEKTQREHHLRRVAEGRSLQATAYRLAGAAMADGDVLGRYLYLRPDAEPMASVVAVGDDPAFGERFGATVRALFAAWDAGGFFPRVVDPAGDKEPVRCSFCRVAEACVRGDSGARRRLHSWASRSERPETAAEAAALGVWRLHDPDAVDADSEAGVEASGSEDER